MHIDVKENINCVYWGKTGYHQKYSKKILSSLPDLLRHKSFLGGGGGALHRVENVKLV
jgi:hypothetical protein